MKTTLCAGLIFAVILASGIWFDSITAKICNDYQNALTTTTEENGLRILDEMNRDWNRRSAFFAAFTHHSLLDEIQNALTRTKAALSENNPALFAIELETLKNAIAALKESDIPNLSNVF